MVKHLTKNNFPILSHSIGFGIRMVKFCHNRLGFDYCIHKNVLHRYSSFFSRFFLRYKINRRTQSWLNFKFVLPFIFYKRTSSDNNVINSMKKYFSSYNYRVQKFELNHAVYNRWQPLFITSGHQQRSLNSKKYHSHHLINKSGRQKQVVEEKYPQNINVIAINKEHSIFSRINLSNTFHQAADSQKLFIGQPHIFSRSHKTFRNSNEISRIFNNKFTDVSKVDKFSFSKQHLINSKLIQQQQFNSFQTNSSSAHINSCKNSDLNKPINMSHKIVKNNEAPEVANLQFRTGLNQTIGNNLPSAEMNKTESYQGENLISYLKPNRLSEKQEADTKIGQEEVGRVAEEVYTIIENKIRTEKERRGIFF